MAFPPRCIQQTGTIGSVGYGVRMATPNTTDTQRSPLGGASVSPNAYVVGMCGVGVVDAR